MTVTNLQKKRKYLTSVYIDFEYAVDLDTRVLEENRIMQNTEIDDDKLRYLISQSEHRRAKEKALWLISFRDHSSKELHDKLRKDYSEEVATDTVERMFELRLLDDESYARRLAKDLCSKHQSPSNIRQKLIQKGIDRETAESIVEELDIDPVEEICALIEKKYSSKLSDEKDLRRTVAALQRAGYKWSDIKSGLSRFEEDNF